MKKRFHASRLLYLLPAAMLIALDQWVKQLAVEGTNRVEGAVWGLNLPGLVRFIYTENRGMAFGLLQNGRWLFIPLTVIALGLLLYVLTTRLFPSVWGELSLMLIFAGAVGNFIDRVFNGFVVDFIQVLFVEYAIFNVADICVVCGGISLLLYVFIKYRPVDGKSAESGDAPTAPDTAAPEEEQALEADADRPG